MVKIIQISLVVKVLIRPFQVSGGGAGATGDYNETGGNSTGLRHFGSVICVLPVEKILKYE